MNLAPIGAAVRRKRIALGLTPLQLAALANLSERSLGEIEHGSLNATLETIGRVLDMLGLIFEIRDVVRLEDRAQARALRMAAKGANVSYDGMLTGADLENALATGVFSPLHHAQLAHVLNEAPLQLVVRVVAEVATRRHREPAEIWRNVRVLAQRLDATRGGLWV